MKRINNRLFLTFFLVIVLITQSKVSVSAVGEPYLTAEASLIVDAETGIVMYGENIDEQLGMASITKLMSTYVTLDEIKKQGISMDDTVNISERVSLLKQESPDASGVWYYPGEPVTIEQLLNLSLIFSDNGATIALAEHVSGSEQKHVEKMNEKAKELGMDKTVFYNVTGLTSYDYGDLMLPNVDPNDYNVSSARDLAILAIELLDDYPGVLEITKKPSYVFRGEELHSYNLMLEGLSLEYDNVIGLKTGTTDEAGSCFVGYLDDPENGRAYISVVLGAEDMIDRFEQSGELYDWMETQILKPFTIDPINVDFCGAKSYSDNTLSPRSNYQILSDQKVNIKLEGIDLNEEYFNSSDCIEKDIPEGEVVATLEFVNVGDVPIETVFSGENQFGIEFVTAEGISYRGDFMMFISSLFDFFENLMDSMFAN